MTETERELRAQVSALQAVLIEARDELDAWRRFAEVRGMGAARTHAGLLARISEVLAR